MMGIAIGIEIYLSPKFICPHIYPLISSENLAFKKNSGLNFDKKHQSYTDSLPRKRNW